MRLTDEQIDHEGAPVAALVEAEVSPEEIEQLLGFVAAFPRLVIAARTLVALRRDGRLDGGAAEAAVDDLEDVLEGLEARGGGDEELIEGE